MGNSSVLGGAGAPGAAGAAEAGAGAAATARAPAIRQITTVDGRTFAAKVWIDASYEGDLLARAGVSYRVGREAASEYNETLAGMSAGARSNQFDIAVDPFDESGDPLPFTSLPPQGRAIGSGD